MSALSDSGFEEDCPSPSPSQCLELRWVAESSENLTADWSDFQDYDESSFIIQRHNEEEFLAKNCLVRQPQVTAEARCKLVSWLIAVHRHFKLTFESCCLAVNIMDRFLITTPVAEDCFQLLGVTSLLIATKQVEVCSPQIKQLLSLCCDAFSREQLCNLECLVLLRLNFRLAVPTHAFFLDYYANQCFVGQRLDGGTKSLGDGAGEYDQRSVEMQMCKGLSRRICELSLADYAFNNYLPSVIAQCAVNLAGELLRIPQNEHPSTDTINLSGLQGGEAQMEEKTHTNPPVEEDSTPLGGDSPNQMQHCMENLRLLVSLNEEALQALMTL